MFDIVVVSSKDLCAVLLQEHHFTRFKLKEIPNNNPKTYLV